MGSLNKQNDGCSYDSISLNGVYINLTAASSQAETYKAHSESITNEHRIAFLLRAITLIDLTTLGGDDTKSNVARLCQKANSPLPSELLEQIGFETPITTAAVCVYPSRVADAVQALKKLNAGSIEVASVATGFPSGQMPLATRLGEIKYAVSSGATEIDIVINRALALTGEWHELYDELRQMKAACGPGVHLKAILAVGELDSLDNIYRASMVAMMAGADFIKTSTGKEAVNATLPFGLVMCRAIRDYYAVSGVKVGLKPAGGLKTHKDVIAWMIMVKEELDVSWLAPSLFRFGASSLLDNVEAEIGHLTNQLQQF